MENQPELPPGFYKQFLRVVEKVALKSLATGNFAWFVLLMISGGLIWKLSSADLKEVLLKVFATLGWLGYVVAGITVVVSVKILRWREQFYQDELRRMSEVRNEVLQSRLELPLQSSVKRIDTKDEK